VERGDVDLKIATFLISQSNNICIKILCNLLWRYYKLCNFLRLISQNLPNSLNSSWLRKRCLCYNRLHIHLSRADSIPLYVTDQSSVDTLIFSQNCRKT